MSNFMEMINNSRDSYIESHQDISASYDAEMEAMAKEDAELMRSLGIFSEEEIQEMLKGR